MHANHLVILVGQELGRTSGFQSESYGPMTHGHVITSQTREGSADKLCTFSSKFNKTFVQVCIIEVYPNSEKEQEEAAEAIRGVSSLNVNWGRLMVLFPLASSLGKCSRDRIISLILTMPLWHWEGGTDY